MIRRHAKSDQEMHFGPALRVVSGNYIAAKRRGILDGVDFGYTGEVRRAGLPACLPACVPACLPACLRLSMGGWALGRPAPAPSRRTTAPEQRPTALAPASPRRRCALW
jgi:hypothetical protein